MPQFNAAAVRFFGDERDLLTIRIALDAPPQRRSWLAPR
jgi:hypothetical protein